ncbi:MAG: 3D-(3,5/4)-trihydroxycyclohexane-1,2-dione acylhydrolase (decyclizing) [Solirubrobacteraceae bacterium]
MRLTVAQALVRFLANQHSERDGVEQRLIAGCFGIFGHGNVAGVGQALLEQRDDMPYVLARNEQAMVHAAAGFARQRNRLSTYACTASVGPGSTNMVTGAALATINRLPVLLLPGDIFATRVASPVLQELEDPSSLDVSVNDCLEPVSRFWDRINRPEQLIASALAAMRVLTDPAETGAVTISLPQDVQAEAYDWPEEFFERRVWHVRRPPAESERLAEAAALLRGARRPLIVSGGGTIYADATGALRALAEATGVPVAETQAGKGSLPYDHLQSVGAIGATGTTAANAIAREADVVFGVGTRWSDFTTASRSVFADPGVRFVNLNVAPVDAVKHAGVALTADARVGLEALRGALTDWRADPEHTERARSLAAEWDATVEHAYTLGHGPLPAQSEVLGVVNRVSAPRDVVVCAAGSMPGDLHKLWRTRDPKGYHVEYGFSCMGYEIAGGLGVKLAAPDREVYVMVGDGSFLMMAQEIVTAVQEQIKLTIVLVQNHGFASIGALSESVGSQRFGTSYRGRDGEVLPVDLAAVAAGLGADVRRATTIGDFEAALREAAASPRITVVEVQTDPLLGAPDSEAWWDVPVAEVAALDSTRAARKTYEQNKATQRHYVT